MPDQFQQGTSPALATPHSMWNHRVALASSILLTHRWRFASALSSQGFGCASTWPLFRAILLTSRHLAHLDLPLIMPPNLAAQIAFQIGISFLQMPIFERKLKIRYIIGSHPKRHYIIQQQNISDRQENIRSSLTIHTVEGNNQVNMQN